MRLFVFTWYIVCFTITGCSSALYEWDGYEDFIEARIFHPEQTQYHERSLRRLLDKAEKQGKVPPGLYAELGHVLLKQGNNRDAIAYFEKEQQLWPESKTLMTALIAYARSNHP